MSRPRTCPECGASIPEGSPAGLCPRCLMEAAVAQSELSRPRPQASIDQTAATVAPGVKPPDIHPAVPRRSVSFEEFQSAIATLKLVGPEELLRFAREASGDLSRLAGELIRAGKLSTYQAQALAQGKAKGLLIGDYLIQKKIGQGGMGVVFMARHRRLDQIVALKILPPSFGRDREAVLRFRREVAVAARLEHPNVVAALDASEDRGVHFLAMEYIEGHDLDNLVRTYGTTADQAYTRLHDSGRARTRGRARARDHSSRHQAGQFDARHGRNCSRPRPRTCPRNRIDQHLGRHSRRTTDAVGRVHGHGRLHGSRASRRL